MKSNFNIVILLFLKASYIKNFAQCAAPQKNWIILMQGLDKLNILISVMC